MGSCCSSEGVLRVSSTASFQFWLLGFICPVCKMYAGGRPDTLGQEMLAAHNVYRSKHAAPPLQWSAEAAQAANHWATRLARIGACYHSVSTSCIHSVLTRRNALRRQTRTRPRLWHGPKPLPKDRCRGSSRGQGPGGRGQLVW